MGNNTVEREGDFDSLRCPVLGTMSLQLCGLTELQLEAGQQLDNSSLWEGCQGTTVPCLSSGCVGLSKCIPPLSTVSYQW